MLVIIGLSIRKITYQLFLSARSDETHVQNILTKLDFHSRTQIAAWAASGGIVAGRGT